MASRLLSFRFLLCLFAMSGVLWFTPDSLFSEAGSRSTTSLPLPSERKAEVPGIGQLASEGQYGDFKPPSLISQATVLALLSLLPFIIMILTPFMKIVIVLSLLRSALGAQQAPPNQILNGVSLMLSLFIMYPVGLQMYEASQSAVSTLKTPESVISKDSSAYVIAIASVTREPFRDFLKRNSSAKHQALFYRMAYRVLPEANRPELKPTDFIVVIPSYITSQLKDAFEIGVLIYIPFFVIDLVTSNILLAMGMMMLSPVTISMPLKLFLLVMLDGWTLLVEGLVNTFH
jgi:type III secretion protein R